MLREAAVDMPPRGDGRCMVTPPEGGGLLLWSLVVPFAEYILPQGGVSAIGGQCS